MSVTSRSGTHPVHHVEQGRRVAGLADHLVARLLQQQDQPTAEQGLVLPHHHAHHAVTGTSPTGATCRGT